LTIISTVHTKTWFRFAKENINKELHDSGHDRKSERRKIDSYQKIIVYLKKKRWKHYYLPPKIKRLSYFVLSGLLFFITKRLFTSNRWFCWPV
jgi:hypothetical protein